MLAVARMQQQVAGEGEAVRADARVLGLLVAAAPEGGQADDGVAGADAAGVDHPGPLHPGEDGGVDDDGPDQVAEVGRLASRQRHSDSQAPQAGGERLVALDDPRHHLAPDPLGVAPDGVADDEAVDRPHADQIVEVHDDGVLRQVLPDRGLPRLAVLDVRHRRLGPGPVGVHDRRHRPVARDVGHDLAKRRGKEARGDPHQRPVDVLLGGGYAASFVLAGHRGREPNTLARGSRDQPPGSGTAASRRGGTRGRVRYPASLLNRSSRSFRIGGLST